MPNITLFLEGYDYILIPKDYSYELNIKNKFGVCLGFDGIEEYKITLGGTFMHGYDIIFDRENQKIGFAKADCNRIESKINKDENMDNETFIKKEDLKNINNTHKKADENDKNYTEVKTEETINNNETYMKKEKENINNETFIKENNNNDTNIKKEEKENNYNDTYIKKQGNNDRDIYVQKVEETNKNLIKLNNKLIITIIIISSVLVICLIILIIIGIRKKCKIETYKIQVDESIENEKGKNHKNIINVLDIKNQNSNSNEISNV